MRDRETTRLAAELGYISLEDCDALLEFCDAFDGQCSRPRLPRGEEMYPGTRRKINHSKNSTLKNYSSRLRRVAFFTELTGSDTESEDVNQTLLDIRHGGTENPIDSDEYPAWHSRISTDGIAASTADMYAKIVTMFYRWYSIENETKVHPLDIIEFDTSNGSGNGSRKSWDERDMLIPDEIQALYDACQSNLERALFYLLLWTGMRKKAVMNLKWRDVDLEQGEYYFPTTQDGEGLKDIFDITSPRPLYHTWKVLRAWKDDHPDSDDSDSHVITVEPVGRGSFAYDASSPVSDSTIGRMMARISDRTDISKPTHPHMMRHNFVTILRKAWGIDPEDVKWHIGHAPGSNVMQTTYSHLTAEDRTHDALVAAGFKDPEDRAAVYRGDSCVNCGNHTNPSDMHCRVCGAAQDAKTYLRQKEVNETVDDAVHGSALQAETDEERSAADRMRQARNSSGDRLDRDLVEQLLEQNHKLMERVEELEKKTSDDNTPFDPSSVIFLSE